jgi:hypothetical protein
MDLCSILGSLEGFWTTDETIDGLMLNKCLGSVSVCFPFCTELVGYLVPTHATMKMHVLSCKDILHAARKLRGEQFTSTDSLCFTEKKKKIHIRQKALESYAWAGNMMANWISDNHGD